MEKILIVDDSAFNRTLLSDMLSDEYTIFEASNGVEAISILNDHFTEISLMILDMVMPVMDGLETMEYMNKSKLIFDIPVVMISSEDSSEAICKAYNLGVSDFIARNLNQAIVKKRLRNIIALYSKQKKLQGIIADQFYEKEKNFHIMIEILAHTIEFRNGECGMHIINVQNYTEILLKELAQLTDKYHLDDADIALISTVSALHDVGKIAIPDEILNKPGKLTDEEFTIMKSHSAVGAEMLANLPCYHDEPIVKLSRSIARWHHERWNGKGYPDHLAGDDIPIEAQVVSIADVYDALTADRVYKKAFSHQTAIQMICNGECGEFNPLLITCMLNTAEQLRLVKEGTHNNINNEYEFSKLAQTMLKNDVLYSSDNLLHLVEYEKAKNNFLEKATGGLSFEYNFASKTLMLSEDTASLTGLDRIILNPMENQALINAFGRDLLLDMSDKITSTTQHSIIRYNVELLPEEHRFVITDENSTSACNAYELCFSAIRKTGEQKDLIAIIGKFKTK